MAKRAHHGVSNNAQQNVSGRRCAPRAQTGINAIGDRGGIMAHGDELWRASKHHHSSAS